jgi:hypothetical protein
MLTFADFFVRPPLMLRFADLVKPPSQLPYRDVRRGQDRLERSARWRAVAPESAAQMVDQAIMTCQRRLA